VNGKTDVYETPARMVRTGQVIKVAADGYRRSLEVEIVHHETRTDPDTGERTPAVWFTGWDDNCDHIQRGWGQQPDAMVLVVEDVRGHSYLTLTGCGGEPETETYLL